MGSGIAQVAIQSGFDTILYDVNEKMLAASASRIESDLRLRVGKGKLDQADAEAMLDRLRCTTNIDQCVADFIIEAIAEIPEAKEDLFARLANINSVKTILATNTSSLSVSRIASRISSPGRFGGMHFFNPAPVMKLVEVVATSLTDQKTIDSIVSLAIEFGKTPVLCRDSPGFIVNHIARPYYLEALRLAETGLVDIETIDGLMESTGFRMGPFRLMDLIGNDINYTVSQSVYEALGRPARLMPSSLQSGLLQKNHLGRKTGKGYYTYG